MKRMSWLLVVPLALGSASSFQAGCLEFDTFNVGGGGAAGASGSSSSTGMGTTSSSSGSGGSGGSMGVPCKVNADCAVDMETECHKNGTCQNNFCVSGDPAAGTLLKDQIYGDCLDIVCDGNGGVNTMKSNMADKYVWGNSCYLDTCGTMPSPNLGTACTTSWNKPGTCDVNLLCVECSVDADCGGGGKICIANKCVPGSCKDMMPGGDETDIDCGGSCAACAKDQKCLQNTDCQGGGFCVGSPKVCKAPACDDGLPNGDETDLDCGGSCVSEPNGLKTCMTGLKCLLPGDCTSGRCEAGKCK